jgi:hypothetical protein
MYLEGRLPVTLSELSSLQLAMKLVYNELNETHTESKVISNSIAMKEAHVGLKLPSNWYTIKSKSNRPGNKSGRAEFSQSVGPVTVTNKFAALSNLLDFTLSSDEAALQDDKRTATISSTNNSKSSQRYANNSRKHQHNQHHIHQVSTTTNNVPGSVSYPRSDIKYNCIPTIVNGCTASYKSGDSNVCNSDGASNIQRVLNESYVNTQVRTPKKTTVGSGNNKVRFKGKSVNMKSNHKVVIYGDSHTRGLSVRLKDKLPDSFEVINYTKLNSNILTLLSTRSQDIINLTNKDVRVFMGGTNDLASKNFFPIYQAEYSDKYYSSNNTLSS